MKRQTALFLALLFTTIIGFVQNNESDVMQLGDKNSTGSNWWNNPGIDQEGNGNETLLGQIGVANTASINQLCNNNTAQVTQFGTGNAIA